MLKTLFAIVLASCPLSSFAQTTQSLSVHLDVVSIKENHSEQEKGYLEIPPNGARIIVRNTPMFRIIGFAFNKQRNDLIEGLPQWTRDLKWDIEATIAEESILALLTELNHQNKITILMVSHHIHTLRHRAHRVVVVNDQGVVSGPAEELLRPERLAELLAVTI